VIKNNIKLAILAGGYGSRISEETILKPKPLVEIGGKPIIWHIMKYYSVFGVKNFLIACGYKGHLLKEYFANYFIHNNDITIDIENNSINFLHKKTEPWKVTLIDTGHDTSTGGRIKKLKKYVEKDDFFLLTYGDGLSDVNINNLIRLHKKLKKIATVTSIVPKARYGSLKIKKNIVKEFNEKQDTKNTNINGGFLVCSPDIIKFIKSDKTSLEYDTLKIISQNNQLAAYKHNGFWQSMDTLRDKNLLNALWETNKAPWKIW